MTDKNLLFVRRSMNNGNTYFISNSGNEKLEGWVPLAARNVNIIRDESRIRIWAEYDTEVRVPYYSRTFHLRPSAERNF